MAKSGILGLDISSASTGWAYSDSEGNIKDFGVIKMTSKRHSERLAFFERELKSIFKRFNPLYLGIEDIWNGRNAKTYKILALYHGVAYKVGFEKLKEDPVILSESEIREKVGLAHNVKLEKTADKSKKEAVFDFLNTLLQLNFNFKTHNDITDAIAVAMSTYLVISDEEKYGSLQDFRTCARSKSRRSKKSVQKTGKKVSSRSKSRRP